eukprot:TRINITY_DN44205_c0_g1_i1.p1 TRINITY_DN44205_c0_g1~~TRINITY_DN44205_c0_g1_i1.p1  ORF type:complete len:223 (-),score=39.70 TRINITY_DN44205_c0_g1_i1:273-941(-)
MGGGSKRGRGRGKSHQVHGRGNQNQKRKRPANAADSAPPAVPMGESFAIPSFNAIIQAKRMKQGTPRSAPPSIAGDVAPAKPASVPVPLKPAAEVEAVAVAVQAAQVPRKRPALAKAPASARQLGKRKKPERAVTPVLSPVEETVTEVEPAEHPPATQVVMSKAVCVADGDDPLGSTGDRFQQAIEGATQHLLKFGITAGSCARSFTVEEHSMFLQSRITQT